MLESVESLDMTKHRGAYRLDLQEQQQREQSRVQISWPLCAGQVRPARQVVSPEVDPRESQASGGATISSGAPSGDRLTREAQNSGGAASSSGAPQ